MLSIAWYRLKECSSRANKDNKEVKLKSFVERCGVVEFPRHLLHYTAETKDMIFIFKPLSPANSWLSRSRVWFQLVNNHKRAEPVKATRCW